MTYLITGACGFIGSNFLKYMMEKYENGEFILYDSLTYAGKLSNIEWALEDKRVKFYIGDIKNGDLVENLFKRHKIDYVINFAAESHVDRSIEYPDIFLESNVLGVNTLLKVCRKYWKNRRDVKFLQISTDEVYGSLTLENREEKFRENTPLNPRSPYSASKASGDMLLMAYGETYGIPFNITRCSNNYGEHQLEEKLIPLVIKKALKNEKLPIYGKGDNVRDWIYVMDHCKGVDLVLHRGKPGEIYNIGGNSEMSNIDLVKNILDILEKPYDLITFVKDRPGHDKRYGIDSSKIERELGWKRDYDFKRGLLKTVNWYKELWEKKI
ncbi:dTDP-glucose 4,6-dehydratase [Cetobacterium ceti]|uniref:dTDP-glucose 4,6-dehydratase n=1 Tax=Cetobacterium ceti TaxID=180163 RepID=A0A1T4LUB5_9FUSO|nr:dTDP-glucose 4,6-dehydratase [Cetobacterium ceti]SJZ58206.1 dTDP-glucose 4,6-dehydratase [Cetobacterium ceti]